MNEDRMMWKLKRIQAGIRVKDIADYMDFSSSYITQYESGKKSFGRCDEDKYRKFIADKLA